MALGRTDTRWIEQLLVRRAGHERPLPYGGFHDLGRHSSRHAPGATAAPTPNGNARLVNTGVFSRGHLYWGIRLR